jgi:hypothetical protein
VLPLAEVFVGQREVFIFIFLERLSMTVDEQGDFLLLYDFEEPELEFEARILKDSCIVLVNELKDPHEHIGGVDSELILLEARELAVEIRHKFLPYLYSIRIIYIYI